MWAEQAFFIYVGLDPWRYLIYQKSMEMGEKGASLHEIPPSPLQTGR